MRDDRRRLLFTNCTVWTGEIGSAARREVLVEGMRSRPLHRASTSSGGAGLL